MKNNINAVILNSVKLFSFAILIIIAFSFQSETKANTPDFSNLSLTTCLSGDDCLKKPDACKEGFVWREIDNRDRVCVLPDAREQAKRDNQEAEKHRQFLSESCKDGYVWREAYPGDKVCVTPETKERVKYDNSQAFSRNACKAKVFANLAKNINSINIVNNIISNSNIDPKSEAKSEAILDFEKTTTVSSGGKEIDKPKMLITRYTVFNTKGDDKENFFAFMAKGEIEILYDMKLQGRSGVVNITLYDKNGDELAPEITTTAFYNGSDRAKHIVDIGEKQLVILKVVSIRGGFESDRTNLKITLKKGIAR